MSKSEQSNISIDDLLAGDLKLASPPEIFIAIDSILNDKTKTTRDAGMVIEHDPGLAARLLKIVNSALYGLPARIVSIPHAVTMLGARELRYLVMATVVIERFSAFPGGLLSMREFWSHSVRGALFAKAMASREAPDLDVDAIFACALLHEIGRLVFYLKIPDLARQAALLAAAQGGDECLQQKQILGFDHYQTGAELVRRWNFPEIIAATMEHHQDPGRAKEYERETTIVAIASRLSSLAIAKDDKTAEPHRQWLAQIEAVPPDLIIESITEEVEAQLEATFRAIFPA
ncbi:MAG: HDOD domain-containing protein [Pseudomonadota bacterium]